MGTCAKRINHCPTLNDYLANLVNELECSPNVRVEGNTLIFRKMESSFLQIEVTFGKRGTQESFKVENIYGTVIYEITSEYSSDLAFAVSLSLIIPIVGVISIYFMIKFYKKRKNPKNITILEN